MGLGIDKNRIRAELAHGPFNVFQIANMPAHAQRGETVIDEFFDVTLELVASAASGDVNDEKLVDGIDGDEVGRILIIRDKLLRPIQFPVVQQQGYDDALLKHRDFQQTTAPTASTLL